MLECKPTGPPDAKILFVAEAPGSEEEQEGKPLVGTSGQEFSRCLKEAGIPREICRLDNVFHWRPPGNRFHAEWCDGKKAVSEEYKIIRENLVKICPETL